MATLHNVSALTLLILVLFAYRLTRLIAVDDITSPLRDRAHGWLGELVTCPFCVGVWVSAAVVLFAANTVLTLQWEWVVLAVGAVAGGQALCSSADARLND